MKYEIIYCDPPWNYNDKMKGLGLASCSKYETLTKQRISNLPIQQLAKDDCCLFLWVTSPLLDEGIEVLKNWGFEYKTIVFCWSKITKNGKSVSNLGRWTMGNIELCLLGVKGKPNPWREDKSIKQFIRAIRTKHSKKPNEVRRRIVQLFGDRSRIELFATQRYEGWTTIGYEIDGLDIKDSLEKIIKKS